MGEKHRAIVVASKACKPCRPWLWVDGKWSRPHGVSISRNFQLPPLLWEMEVTQRLYAEWNANSSYELSAQEVIGGPHWDVLSGAELTEHHRRDVLVFEFRRAS